MRFAAAYLLVKLSGREPTKENIPALLESVGIEWTPRGDELLKAMEGKDIDEVLATGEEMLVKPIGGGSGPAASGAAGDSDGATEAQETAAKAEVQEVEVDMDMGDFMGDDY